MRVKKIFSIPLSAVLSIALAFSFPSAQGYAKNNATINDVSSDVTASLSLDKSEYDNGSAVKSTLTLVNNKSVPVNISLSHVAPEGFSVSSSDKINSLAAGETKSVSIVYTNGDSPDQASKNPSDSAKKADQIPTYVVKQKLDISSEFENLGTIAGYTVSDKNLAKVSKKGSVKFKNAGQVTIGAYTKEGKTKTPVSKTITINIEKPTPKKASTLNVGLSANGVSYLDGITNAKAAKWVSSKPAVVEVDSETGVIRALKSGSAKITAFFGDGKNAAKYKIKIKVPKTSSGSDKNNSESAKSAESTKTSARSNASGASVSAVDENTVTASASAKVKGTAYTFKTIVTFADSSSSASGPVDVSFTDKSVRVTNLVSSVKNAHVNTGTASTFTVKMVAQEVQSGASVELVDDDGNVIGYMKDDGSGVDSEANDGIFSASVDLESDERGDREYYARFGSSKSESESVYFYTDIPSSEKTAMIDTVNEINSFDSTNDVRDYLVSQNHIDQSSIQVDGNIVSFTTNNGIRAVWEPDLATVTNGNSETAKGDISFDPEEDAFGEISEIRENVSETHTSDTFDDPETSADIDEDASISSSDETASIDTVTNSTTSSSSKKDILVVRPFRGTEFKYDDFITAANTILEGKPSGAEVVVRDDGEANLDLFTTFGNYGTVLIDSHGTKSYGQPYMLTGSAPTTNTFRQEDADYQAGRVILAGGRVAVGYKFFEDYYNKDDLNKTVLFLGTCLSSYNDEIIPKTMVANGARGVYGYDNAVSVSFCNKTLYKVADALKAHKNAADAYDYAVSQCGDTDTVTIYKAKFLFEGPVEANVSSGTISGRVITTPANGSKPITNAVITITGENGYTESYPVDENGNFEIPVPVGTYTVSISAYGYITDNRSNITVGDDQTIRLSDASLVLAPTETESKTARIYGYIDDVATADLLDSAVIRFRKDRDNSTGEYISYDAGQNVIIFTDEDGYYDFSQLPLGYYTMEVSLGGYATSYRNIYVENIDENNAHYYEEYDEAYAPNRHDFSLSRILPDDALRVVLGWDEAPTDLDSHMVGPTPEKSFFHTWFNQTNRVEKGIAIAALDRDDVDCFGPETTTVLKEVDGTYYFFVHNFSGEHPLTYSGAWVQVYKGDHLEATYHVPVSDFTESLYWNVFSYDSASGTLTEIAEISDTAETGSYGITQFNQEDPIKVNSSGSASISSVDSTDTDNENHKTSAVKDAAYIEKAIREGQAALTLR